MIRDDGKILNERVPQKLIDNRNNLKKENNVSRLSNECIANITQWKF